MCASDRAPSKRRRFMAVRVGAQIHPQQASYVRKRDAWLRVIERSINLRPNRVQYADRYVEKGITHLMVGVGGPDYDLRPLRELIAWRDDYRERHPEAAAS
jgi:hypothetical protein